VELSSVAARASLRALFENACQGMMITPEHLRQELEEGGGIPDLVSGVLTPTALRLTAKTLALMHYPYPPEPYVISSARVVSESKNEG
jgi:hypothetical protein